MTRHIAAPLALGVILLAGGCASEPPPPALAQAEQAVRDAQARGAATYAPQEMSLAAARLTAAREAAHNDRPTEAGRLAEEAVVNAELAQARMDATQAQTEAAARAAQPPPVIVLPQPPQVIQPAPIPY